jgi:hypothetical protein
MVKVNEVVYHYYYQLSRYKKHVINVKSYISGIVTVRVLQHRIISNSLLAINPKLTPRKGSVRDALGGLR